MAIGVSFTGYDGKKKEAVARSTADLQSIMGGKVAPVPGAPQVGQRFGAAKMSKKTDPIDGPLIGVRGNQSLEPDGQRRSVGSSGGFRIAVTRTEVNVKPSLEMQCNEVTLVKLEYDLIFSESGLLKGRSEERKVWEKSFFVLADGNGSKGRYGVRAFWEQETTDMPHLNMLAFGSDSDLSTYNSKIGDFGANYEDEEMTKKKAEPPVKIITTAECNAKT